MAELVQVTVLLVQAIVLAVANFLIVLYLTDPTVKGPFDLFRVLRHVAGIEEIETLNMDTEIMEVTGTEVGDGFWAQVLDCHRCLSPYGAIFLIVFSWLLGLIDPAWTFIILWLSITGMTILIFEYLDL
jgi:hypothetical protein